MGEIFKIFNLGFFVLTFIHIFSFALNRQARCGNQHSLFLIPDRNRLLVLERKYLVLIIDDGNPARHTYGLGSIKGFPDISYATSPLPLLLSLGVGMFWDFFVSSLFELVFGRGFALLG